MRKHITWLVIAATLYGLSVSGRNQGRACGQSRSQSANEN
jgi:hypothetical protein